MTHPSGNSALAAVYDGATRTQAPVASRMSERRMILIIKSCPYVVATNNGDLIFLFFIARVTES